MKTLVEMYSAQLALQNENKPLLSESMFLSAFPGKDSKKLSKELRRKSEDLMEEFIDTWRKRVEDGISTRIEAGLTPEQIVEAVPYMTRAELFTLMEKIDELFEGDTPEILALKAIELNNQFTMFRMTATEILQSLWGAHAAAKQQRNIITAPGITDALGMPISSAK